MASRLGDLAAAIGVELRGDPDLAVTGIGTLQNATNEQISFLSNPRYRRYLAASQAAAVIMQPADAADYSGAVLLSDNPYLSYARAASWLFPQPEFSPGRHPSAVIAESANLHRSSWVGPCSVIGENVKLSAGVFVGPGCVLEDECEIGQDSRLVARVTLCQQTTIGQGCLIHPGVVIGADGFGLANSAGRWEKIPQLGRVRIGDDVEIGANTTIDRGALEDTVLHNGVKLDNQIQIAHNVEIGEHTAIAGCTAVAGSTKIGSHCTVGGLAGLVGHLTIADNVHISATTLVTRSISEKGSYSGGLPAMESAAWRKAVARIRHLDEMAKRLKKLDKE